MANSPQARKRAKQSIKRRTRNISQTSEMRTYVKNVLKSLAKGELDQAKANFKLAQMCLDTLAHRGLVHKNRAARLKSRLNAKIKAAS